MAINTAYDRWSDHGGESLCVWCCFCEVCSESFSPYSCECEDFADTREEMNGPYTAYTQSNSSNAEFEDDWLVYIKEYGDGRDDI